MSSSPLSDIDSDAFEPKSPQGTPQKDSVSKARPTKKSPRTPRKAQQPKKPSPASKGTQSTRNRKPRKRSASEAELAPTPPSKKPVAKARLAEEAPPDLEGPQPNSDKKSKKRSAASAELEEASPSKKPAAKASTPEAPSSTPGGPQPRSRPSRTKHRPARLVDEIEATPSKPAPTPAAAAASSSSAAAPARKKRADPWDPDRLLHSTSSRLLHLSTSQLKKALLDARAWTCLSAADKDELIAMLPEGSLPRLLEDNTEPDMLHEYLRYHEVFSDDLARFLEQLGDGQLDPAWMAQAAEAMEMRARGDFDAWKEREFEEFWGQKHEFVPASGGAPKEKGDEKGEVGKEEVKEEKQK